MPSLIWVKIGGFTRSSVPVSTPCSRKNSPTVIGVICVSDRSRPSTISVTIIDGVSCWVQAAISKRNKIAA